MSFKYLLFETEKTVLEAYENRDFPLSELVSEAAVDHMGDIDSLNDVLVSLIGIMIERSLDMMTGLFAILKAGAAYMPIAPDYPGSRIGYLLKDSLTKIVLTAGEIGKRIEFNGEIVDVRNPGKQTQVITTRGDDVKPGDLAYVIYTSGSTGVPKGTLIEHRSVINRLHWMQRCFPINSDHVILQKPPIVFDVSVWELFWWTFRNGRLICGKEAKRLRIKGNTGWEFWQGEFPN